MGRASVEDGIALPAFVKRKRNLCNAICQNVDESIHIVSRQKLDDGSQPEIPEDPTLPPIVVYGSKAELRMSNIDNVKCGLDGILQALYGPQTQVTKIPSTQWAYNAVMARPGEEPRVRETITLQRPEIKVEEMGNYNQEVSDSVQITQNVDKGFVHYFKYFKPDQNVMALMQVTKGMQGEYDLGVVFQQEGHRCVLTGTVSGRPEEEA